jgi:hypothetical protein
MQKITCLQLRKKLSELKDLKMEFDLESGNVRKSRDVNTLKAIRDRMEKSISVIKEMLDPWDLWRKYENGELVCHYVGSMTAFAVNAKGIIIRDNDKFLLNGNQILFNGECDGWMPHPDGVVIRNENQFMLNGYDLIYRGPYDSVEVHPKGIVINLGQQRFLNGRQMINTRAWNEFKSEQNKYIKLWGGYVHPDGILVERDNKFTLVDVNREKKVLYDGEFDDWEPYHGGVMIRRGSDWFFYDHPIEEVEE